MPETEALLAEYRKNLARHEGLLEEECARLLAAVEAIRALHRPTQVGTRSMCRNCALPFPCATTRALDAALSGSEPDEGGQR